MQDFDLVVAGGGSGGFAAALASARRGLSVLLVERQSALGGTSTHAGVTGWEAGCGNTGIPFELYKRLKKIPHATGIYRLRRHCCWPEDGWFPGGENVLVPGLGYIDTCVRHALGTLDLRQDKKSFRERIAGVVFEPQAMAMMMRTMLGETERVTILTETSVAKAEIAGRRVSGVTLDSGATVRPRFFVDATGDGNLCTACGCELLQGQDAKTRFGEPAAPDAPVAKVNGVSLIFRVTRNRARDTVPVPTGSLPDACWWRDSPGSAHTVQFPDGDLSINILPTMDGAEFLRLGYAASYQECLKRLHFWWNWAQVRFPEWADMHICWIAPSLGVRETRRTVCEYMLKQQDLESGLVRQQHPDIIAIADHPMDFHGAGGHCQGVRSAYGIPYRCLIPKGFDNLLVSCRAAGLSSLAASSCRLSRTMMQLGQAAGVACALAVKRRVNLPSVSPEELRNELAGEHVCLDFPPTPELAAHLRCE